MRFIPTATVDKTIHGLNQTAVFSVLFQKSDGSLRTINCRKGVKSYAVGGKSTLNHDDYVNVFDMNKQGYRSIRKDHVLAIKQGEVEVTA